MQPAEQRQEPGKWKAVTLTVLMHVLLVAALFFGIRWQNRAPPAVDVEVWREVPAPTPAPPVAALPPPAVVEPPRPPAPKAEPTPPAKPDIAVKAEKPEAKKPEPKKPEAKKPEPPKPEAKPSELPRPSFKDAIAREMAQLDIDRARHETQQRAEQEARAAQQAQADRVTAARAKELADYVARIRGKVRGNVVLPPGVVGNPEAVFEVVQLPSGEVLNVKLQQSSGSKALDAAIERAILKSSPLPKPPQAAMFQRVLELRYRPVED